jgi:hypothetical protein
MIWIFAVAKVGGLLDQVFDTTVISDICNHGNGSTGVVNALDDNPRLIWCLIPFVYQCIIDGIQGPLHYLV